MPLVDDIFLLIELQIKVFGFKEIKNLYLEDLDFGEAWKACIELVTLDRTKWLNFIILNGMLFREVSGAFQQFL